MAIPVMEASFISGKFPTTAVKSSLTPQHPGLSLARGGKTFPFCCCKVKAHNIRLAEIDASECQTQRRMFILGMGFVATVFTEALRKQGWFVSGTCKTITKKKELEERGFDVYHFDANELELSILNEMKNHSHLLVSIPPVVGSAHGDPMLQHGEILRSGLMGGNLQRLSYLSSTSVYGDCGGNWVDEDHPTVPSSELAKSRIVAEEGWLNLGQDLGLSTQIFRLGGIYGPRRSAVDTIIKQETLSKGQKLREKRQFTSRVHVDDICQALMASIHSPCHGRIYNIVDDDPAPREEVFAYAWELVNNKWPHKTKPLRQQAESFINGVQRGDKRVLNSRMKRELGVKLIYPSYRSGLLSIIDRMTNPFE